ncbi:nucleolar protein nop56, putative [Entamoeba invadens IP1]|uniref:nucleolar protein nop56, putative n=1 Tax=Entamoeba invadens IP1 TaxID=370355 RepID=UPI0002C3EA4F|nr:nucleolar protein nop56, putative [Entamoeba invadens IP1]ELP85194.1 nucleolar protein nop56, putative [Entamoeba invadens IP1]|eukprot:XP_004184540.1 nucleolar protein nop56, putative [Entamoeba invadens IP1]
MLILHETPAGYAVFKVTDEDVLNIASDEEYNEALKKTDPSNVVSLDYLLKFEKAEQAVDECQAVNDGVMTPLLHKFLKATVMKTDNKEMIVIDSNLSQSIRNKLKLETPNAAYTLRLDRLIRENIEKLMPEISSNEMHSMEMGLSHHWSSFKIKFSPDKIDTMVIQAVSLLDDLDKEINNYGMRIREWYGWHFPELSKFVADQLSYCELVVKIGMRVNAKEVDMKEYVDPVVEEEIKNASVTSMGSEISDEDLENIKELCNQTIDIIHYREQLNDYLTQRMKAIAPNLTTLLGEMVGARLIAHTGSLINLAKAPGSTIQILGAEKALFRAIKSKKKTPKYGLIYHATLIGQAPAKSKGKISRVLSSKAALCARVDALSDSVQTSMGEKGRELVEERLRAAESKAAGIAQPQIGKFARKQDNVVASTKVFNTTNDIKLKEDKKPQIKEEDSSSEEVIKQKVKTEKMSESSSSDSSESSDSSSEEEKPKKMEIEKPKKVSEDESSSESSSSDSESSSSEAGKRKKKSTKGKEEKRRN